MLFLCGNETVSVEAGDTSFVMCQPTAEDNIDGDVTSAIHGRLFYNGNEHDFTDTAKIANHAGDWIAMFSVKDHSGNEQKAQQKRGQVAARVAEAKKKQERQAEAAAPTAPTKSELIDQLPNLDPVDQRI